MLEPTFVGAENDTTEPGLPVAFHDAHDLVLHYSVGIGGQAGAGHDAHAFAVVYGSLEHISGTDLGNDPQGRRSLLGSLGDLGSAQGEAVHGRMREGRNIDVACLIGRHHTPDGIEQLHRFHGQFLHGPAHERAGLFQRNHFSHRIGPSLPRHHTTALQQCRGRGIQPSSFHWESL